MTLLGGNLQYYPSSSIERDFLASYQVFTNDSIFRDLARFTFTFERAITLSPLWLLMRLPLSKHFSKIYSSFTNETVFLNKLFICLVISI